MKTLSPVRNSCGVILVLGLATSVGAQSVLYVDDDAPPGGDGLAWATAFFDLQDALDAAAASGGVVTEIRLAQGTYTPDRGTGDREASFEMLDGVAIRGGYAGLTEPNPDERDPVLYESVLSGDLFGDDLAGGGCALEPSNCCYAHAYPGCDNASCEESVCAAYPECCAEDWYWHCAEEARDCDGVCWNGLAPNCENSLHVVYASGVGASAVLDGCTITGGNADRHGAPGGEESGGGVYIVGGSPTFDACTIEWNTAEDGGGVANNQGSPAFSNCAIRSNWVSFGFGGGLMSTDGDPSFFNCSFFRNSANFAGGAVQASGGWAQFSECIFIANESFIQGGAYLGTSGDVSFTDCTFADNVSHAGGAVLLGSSGTLPGDVATLTRCTFNGNTALDDGGALYVSTQQATLVECRFVGNEALYRGGGALYTFRTPLQAVGCVFEGNTADDYGGAVHNMDGDPSFLACRFMGNWVPLGDPGGGFYSFSGSPTLTNCAFSGNDAGQGGAMHVHGGIATVTNCVLSQNTANTAGGIQYAGTETMVIANSILWGNSDNSGTGEAAQLLVSSGAVVVDYTCVEGWTGGLGGTGNLGDDPMLADPNGPDGWVGTVDDDLHLLPGSSCIDAGNNAAVPLEVLTDLDGAPRFADDAATADTGSGTPPIVDLGPYEYGALFGDFDGDGDVDEVDYSFFDICFEGPDWPPFFQECALFDFDSDNDVDLDDFGGFQSYYTGS